MSVHFSAKRFTKLKTNNTKKAIWKEPIELFKKLEYLGEQCTKAVRNVKKHLKELNKLYDYNANKISKNKLTKKDCEKEKVLADKIDLYLLHMKKFLLDIEREAKEKEKEREKENDDSIITKSGKVNSNYLHTMESDMPVEA